MNDTILPKMSFAERLEKEIKDKMGDLMTDEDLKKILERGIDNALFQSRRLLKKNYSTAWGGEQFDTYPPLLEELTDKYMKEKVKECVAQWFKDNPEKIEAIMKRVIEKGIMNVAFDVMADSMWPTLQRNIHEMLSQMRSSS